MTQDTEEEEGGTVVGIHDGVELLGRTPSENAIKALEKALEQAKAGEIIGVGLVMQFHDGCGSWGVMGRCTSFSALGAASRLEFELNKLLSEDGD